VRSRPAAYTASVSAPALFVTGFGAFLEVARNPSVEIAHALARDPDLGTGLGVEIVAHELPVSLARSPGAFDDAWASVAAGPVLAILCLGVQREGWFRLEREARARLESEKRDVDGVLAQGTVISGPEELTTRFALDPLVEALRRGGAEDARVSTDAGGFVCERVYHHALRRGEAAGVPALFLHVPPLDAVALEAQVRAVRELVRALVDQVRT